MLDEDESVRGASAPAYSLQLGSISVERLDVKWVPRGNGLWGEWILQTKLGKILAKLVIRRLIERGSIRGVAHRVGKS